MKYSVRFSCLALFTLVGLAVYAGKTDFTDSLVTFGWGFVLGWLAFVFSLINLLLSILIIMKESKTLIRPMSE